MASSTGEALEKAYGYAFLAATLGAAVGICVVSITKALDAVDDRIARKSNERATKRMEEARKSVDEARDLLKAQQAAQATPVRTVSASATPRKPAKPAAAKAPTRPNTKPAVTRPDSDGASASQ